MNRWPFYAADAALLLAGAGLAYRAHAPYDGVTTAAIALCVAAGAGLLALPFLREHAGAVKLWEQANLAEAAGQLSQVAEMARQVQAATAHWHSVQEAAGRAEAATRAAAAQVAAEVARFGEVLTRADQQEKHALRFELDKLRRAEAEMLQVLVHTLDHVHALHGAGVRSGQSQLLRQLANFRAACLDTVRRVGLVSFEAQPGEPFNPQAHQTMDGKEPPQGHVVTATVACGYSFQGQPVRRILVATAAPGEAGPVAENPAQEAETTTFSLGAPAFPAPDGDGATA